MIYYQYFSLPHATLSLFICFNSDFIYIFKSCVRNVTAMLLPLRLCLRNFINCDFTGSIKECFISVTDKQISNLL